MHAAFVPLSPRWPDPAREPSQSWQLALKHLRRFVKPSLGGKAFKSEPPVVFLWIGLQRGESGTKAECIRVGIWDALQQGLHLAALVDAVVQNASNVSRATA
jgi:hypothetical protein